MTFAGIVGALRSPGSFNGLLALALALGAPDAAAQTETLRSGEVELALPLGLQAGAAWVPPEAPLSAAKIELGKHLFFDPRVSTDETVSCATCHDPHHGFASPAPLARGVDGRVGRRNSPTILNRLFSTAQFWDGRAATLDEQAKGPLLDPNEMAMASHDIVEERVRGIEGYGPLLERAYGDPKVTIDRIAGAIAAYERTVLTGGSPFDRFEAGDESAMSDSAVRGKAIFEGKGRCVQCHVSFNFTDESYHNLGVGMDRPDPDLGRFEVSGKDYDRGAFKTPTLRNVALTAPYMHDGSEPTLESVMDLYVRGGIPNEWLSKKMKPLDLTDSESRDVIDFLHALTGPVTNADPPAELPR